MVEPMRNFWKTYEKLHLWLAVNGVLLGLYFVLRHHRGLMNSFADHVTTPLKAALGRLCALTCLSVMELLYALAAVGAAAYAVWSVAAVIKAKGRRRQRRAAGGGRLPDGLHPVLSHVGRELLDGQLPGPFRPCGPAGGCRGSEIGDGVLCPAAG